MNHVGPCPNCASTNLFRSREVGSGGGHAPNYLPGLGGFLSSARFRIVLCKDCGLARFFATPEATAKVAASPKWSRLR